VQTCGRDQEWRWKSGNPIGKLPALNWIVIRTGVRVAEGAGLENRYTRKGIVGSNPTLSVVLSFTNRKAFSHPPSHQI
jgi:hypothetical protein